jgi:hypothetical protein
MWCGAVSAAVFDAAKLTDESWTPRIYSGLDFLPLKRGDGASAIDIYRRSSNACWSFADALIVVTHHGGSIGVGVELAWAASLGIPVLYIHPEDELPSALVKGMCLEADIEVAAINEPHDAFECVTSFLIRHQVAIEDHRRRREAWEQEVDAIRVAIERIWRDAMDDEKDEIAEIARVTPARIERLTRDSCVFASAGLREVHAVAGAMGMDLRFRRGLTAEQRAAFASAVEALALPIAVSLELMDAGELAANDARNRSALHSASEWLDLARRLGFAALREGAGGEEAQRV